MAALLCFGFWQLGQGAYIPAKAWVAQELMQRAWRRTSGQEGRQPPWPWADTHPVARLIAKRGEVDLIVLAGSSGRTLAFGPGHMSASALPGEPGNSIIAGHRDTHFAFLQYLRAGETLRIERPGGRSHLFRVTAIDVVDSRRGSLLLDSDTAMLSLVTCYPFSGPAAGGPMRYVVSAEMVL
ncbi:MAG: class GN sortase [Gammaproteobacteria bacterium]|nr:class GN sortase [Gammaproteobacteria bacterium]MDH4253766.1 class GN sortase [Gammaproteobacteria bacterium]MDH5309695.1 class GN sortase [Gammaproteobacteria bacterium]